MTRYFVATDPSSRHCRCCRQRIPFVQHVWFDESEMVVLNAHLCDACLHIMEIGDKIRSTVQDAAFSGRDATDEEVDEYLAAERA